MSHVPIQQRDTYSIGLLVVRGWSTDALLSSTVTFSWILFCVDLADHPCQPSVVMALYQIKPLQVVNSEGSVVGFRGTWVLKSGRLISAGLNKVMTLTRSSDLDFPSWMCIYVGPLNSG